jgi:acetolactate synthase-1/2/3 large subunit
MADGYARSSGRPAVIVVTPGPGLGNIVSGCMEAFSDDVPLLIVHIDTDRKDVGKSILHELQSPEDIFRHFIKASFRVDEPKFLASNLHNALRTCSTPRKGPVLVSIPFGLLDREVSGQLQADERTPAGPSGPDRVQPFLADLEHILEDKRRPVLLGGKALMEPHAGALVDRICGRGMPFLTTTGGKGVTSDRNAFSFGNLMAKGVARDILTSADVVIAAGTRLRDVDAKRRGVKIENLVHIDVDDRWIGKNYRTALHCAGDIEEALNGLARIVQKRTFDWDIKALKTQRDQEAKGLRKEPGHTFVDLMRNTVPDDTVIVCDLNMPSYWAEYYLPVFSQRSFLMPRGISPIFYSLAAAVGAKIARPDLPCLALCGDGGGLPQMTELATIVKYGIPVTIFVHNNNSFSILENAMQNRHNIDGSMGLVNPNFVKLARSFGIRAKTTGTLGGLKGIFMRDVNWEEPFLVEFTGTVPFPPWNG